MEAFATLKTFLARLAGAPPAAAKRASPPRSPGSERQTTFRHDAGDRRTSKQRSGDAGEFAARRHLERAGLTFVAANVRYRDGEIDLVMREWPRAALATPSLVFVEVRRRARADHGGAAGSVTREKRRRIVTAAAHYLVGLGMRTLPPARFDVVTLDGEPPELRVQWFRDAFRDDG